MLVSNFDSLYDNCPKAENFNWSEFVKRYSRHVEAATKTSVPAISPAEWPPGAQRKKSDVIRIHFAALDLDGVSEDTVSHICEILEPYSFLIYTTWSHGEVLSKTGKWHLRIFAPFNRPVNASEWKDFWPKLNSFVGGYLDQACKDPGRIYLIPSAPVGSEGTIILSQEKAPLDVDLILESPKKSAGISVDAQEALKGLAKSLRGGKSEHQRNLGVVLQKVLKGEVFAEPGNRDGTLFKLAGAIAYYCPNADAKALAAPFEASLKRMQQQHQDAPTMDQVIEKIARHQEGALQELAAFEEEAQGAMRQRIRNAFAGERNEAYTEKELDQFAAEANCLRGDFRKRWIVQHGLSFYVFKDGAYQRPVGFNELQNTVFTDLAPAVSAGVDLFRETKRGKRTIMPEKEMMLEYGTTAKGAIASLSALKSHYDWKTQIFEEAVSPLRPLVPEYIERVDQYFRAIGGAEAEKLLNWVAVVTKLDEPCAALFLHGVSGAGKTLMADGLCRLWVKEEPTALEDQFESFNEELARCPLVLGDERLPCVIKRDGGTADLRSFIQARHRTLKRKFKSPVSMVGSTRLIIAANNRNVFGTKETLTNEDIEAIKDRILYIYASHEARDFLKSLTVRQVENFVKEDEIARHALWLRDNREVIRDGRFLVSGCDSTFHHALTTGTGIRSAICHWLTSYLQEPSTMDNASELLVRIEDGQLLVTARALVSHWGMYETNARAPTSATVSCALSGLSSGKKQLKNQNGIPTNYWKIRTEYLLSWNAENEYATSEEVLGALGLNQREAA